MLIFLRGLQACSNRGNRHVLYFMNSSVVSHIRGLAAEGQSGLSDLRIRSE